MATALSLEGEGWKTPLQCLKAPVVNLALGEDLMVAGQGFLTAVLKTGNYMPKDDLMAHDETHVNQILLV